MASNSQLSQLDPWELPPYLVLRKKKWESLRTYSGYWKEKEEELIAIRSAGQSSSSSAASPSYVGVRKTLEFYLKDGTRNGEGTKTDWIIHEYHRLRKKGDRAAWILEEDVVLRKVFNKKCKTKTEHASSLYRQAESCVKAYKEPKEINCSRCDNNCGNKSDIITETEGLDLPNKAHNQDVSSSSSTVLYSAVKMVNAPRSSFPGHLKLEIIALHGSFSDETSQSLNEGLAVQNKDLGLDHPTLEWLNDELGVLNQNLGVHCDPDAESDNVWKHFTKIRSANDPDEVYAACHRCDKVLKAHPKKHGTSHLKRHINTCSSCSKSNASTDEDREMLHRLRTALDPYKQQKMDEKMESQDDLTELDPWDLNLTQPTPWYVTRSFNRQTQGGHWKEINKEFTAIRMGQQGCWKDIDKEIAVIQMEHQLQVQMQVPKPQYMGLRRTLQFHHQDGSKVDWIMLEYQQLDDMESPVLLLQGCLVIRKVFRYDKDVVASAFSDLDRLLNADDDDEEYFNGESVNTDTTTSSSDYMDTLVDRKRKRTGAASGHKSEVWMHFTKIYSTDRGVVYVVCHSCDRGYSSGRSTNGTSHLWRHNKSCTSKRRRTENANDATTEWEAEIWPRLLLLKNYGEHQPSGTC